MPVLYVSVCKYKVKLAQRLNSTTQKLLVGKEVFLSITNDGYVFVVLFS